MSPGGEPTSIVRIEYAPGEGSALEAPEVAAGAPRRGAGMLLVALASVVALLFWLDRDRESTNAQVPPPVEREEVEPAITDTIPSSTWEEFVEADLQQQPVYALVTSPVRTDRGWLALRGGSSGSSLVSSEDGAEWSSVSTDLAATSFFGLRRNSDGLLRTMASRRVPNEQTFELLPALSTDGFDWQPDESAGLAVSGSRPIEVALGADTTVVVDDRPPDIDEPPPGLDELLDGLVSVETAARACQLVPASSGGTQWFNVFGCDEALLERITGADQSGTDRLTEIAWLTASQQVIIVRLGDDPPDEVPLEAGRQVLAIEATPTGFLAVVLDGLTEGGTNVFDAPARLVRWSSAGGLIDVTSGLDARVQLSAWSGNDLVVTDDHQAFLATSGSVYRSQPPYERWTQAMAAPISGSGGLSTIAIGPEGTGLVFQDAFRHVWIGRVGGEWVRAPQLDDGMARDVVVSSDDTVVVAFEFDDSGFRHVTAPLSSSGYEPSAPVVEQAVTSAHLLTSVAPFGDSWIASARDELGLVESLDGGVTWNSPSGPAEPTGVLAVGTSASGQPSVLRAMANDDVQILETLVPRGGSWVVDTTRAPMTIDASAQIVSTHVGETTMVVVEEPWDQPVTQVSRLLKDFVDAPTADATCVVSRVYDGEAAHYDLLDCAGMVIGRIGGDGAPIGDAVDDQLSFAQEILRSRHTVYLSSPGLGARRIPLAPSQYVLSIATADDGFLALILDSVDVLEDTSLLYSQALSADIIGWDPRDDEIRPIEPPIGISAWSGNRLLANDDGSVSLVTSLGLYRAGAPFEDWDLVTNGPFVRLAPGQVFGSALHGDGLFVDDPGGPGLFWGTCCDDSAASMRSWNDVASNGRAFSRVLISTESSLVFHAPDGETLMVER